MQILSPNILRKKSFFRICWRLLRLLLASAMSASPAAFTIHDNIPLLFLSGRVGLSIENLIFVGQIFCIPNVLIQDVK